MSRRHFQAIFAAALSVGAISTPLSAATINFVNSLGGTFGKASNWSTNSVPATTDVARFDLDSAYTLSLNTSRTLSRVLIGNDKLVFDFSGGGKITAKSSSTASCVLGITKGDVARLTIRGGTLKTNQALLGSATGSSGSVTVNAGGAWNASGILNLGSKGSGNLTVTGGGSVSASSLKLGVVTGAKGTALISGSGSTLTVASGGIVGSAGTGVGQLYIRSGATASFNSTLEVRKRGTLKIEGGTLATAALQRSAGGSILFSSGVLTLTDSDLLVSSTGPLGANLTLSSLHTLNVSDAVLVNPAGKLTINQGRLTADAIDNQGEILFTSATASTFKVNSIVNHGYGLIRGSANVGSDVDNQGEIRAIGSDKLQFTGLVSNAGVINLFNGGTVTVGGNLVNSGQINSSGILNANGGVDNTGALNFETGASIISSPLTNSDFGTLSVNGTSATFQKSVQHDGDYISVAGSSFIEFKESVSGSGNFSGGGDITFLADYNPNSNATGPVYYQAINIIPELPRIPDNEIFTSEELETYHKPIYFQNDVFFNASTGILNLDVVDWSNYDEIHVNGSVQLARVNINVDPGFHPEFSEPLVLLNANQITGSLSNIHVVGLMPEQYSLNLDENTLSITIIPIPEPSTFLLSGAVAALFLRRRPRQKA